MNKQRIEPYAHDCKECEWAGWFSPTPHLPPMNIYLHGKDIIIRHSSEPGDYSCFTAGASVKGALTITDPHQQLSTP